MSRENHMKRSLKKKEEEKEKRGKNIIVGTLKRIGGVQVHRNTTIVKIPWSNWWEQLRKMQK